MSQSENLSSLSKRISELNLSSGRNNSTSSTSRSNSIDSGSSPRRPRSQSGRSYRSVSSNYGDDGTDINISNVSNVTNVTNRGSTGTGTGTTTVRQIQLIPHTYRPRDSGRNSDDYKPNITINTSSTGTSSGNQTYAGTGTGRGRGGGNLSTMSNVSNTSATTATEWILPPKDTWQKVGEGGFGIVFSAFDPTLNRTVLIKQIPKTEVNEKEWLAEAAILQHLSQACGDYIVCFDNKFQDRENYYLIMEFLGQYMPLTDFIEERTNERHPNPITSKEMTVIFCGIINGFQQIAALGVAHRDIKGENILINPETLCIKYIDFGLSCLTAAAARSSSSTLQKNDDSKTNGDEKKSTTSSSSSSGSSSKDLGNCVGTVGTFDFNAPELLVEIGPFSINNRRAGVKPKFEDLIAADLWSLGMTLYELLSGGISYYDDFLNFNRGGGGDDDEEEEEEEEEKEEDEDEEKKKKEERKEIIMLVQSMVKNTDIIKSPPFVLYFLLDHSRNSRSSVKMTADELSKFTNIIVNLLQINPANRTLVPLDCADYSCAR